MKRAPFLILGFPMLIVGLLNIPVQQRPGFDWVPFAQAGFGALLIVIKLIWLWRHKAEIKKESTNA